MSSWIIKDADGNVTNPNLKGSEEFVKANFDHYEALLNPDAEEVTPMTPAEEARSWRNGQLSMTDHIVSLSDHSQRDAYLTYRQELRDWPSTSEFPSGTKPTLGS